MQKIMFNDRFGLTDSVLKGEKTQTRRVIKPQPELSDRVGFMWKNGLFGVGADMDETYRNFIKGIKTPYEVGEIVAVAQRYSAIDPSAFQDWERDTDWFKKGWRNKMFTKPEKMPHQIKITNVRVEQLQDISEEDCLKEGVFSRKKLFDYGREYVYRKFMERKGRKGKILFHVRGGSPRAVYARLIDDVSGKGTWDSNPWVFVYDFRLVE